MALKAVLSKSEVEALPEAMRGLYTDTDGTYNINAELLTLANAGLVPDAEVNKLKTSVREFRDTNIKLMTERDGLKTDGESLKTKLAGFDGIDVAEYTTLKADKVKLAAKGVKDPEDMTKLITEAVAAATKPLIGQLATISADREALAKKEAANTVDNYLRTAATAAGARDNALNDVLARGRGVFRFVDGNVVAMDGDKPLFSEADPTKVLDGAEYMAGLAKSADFLFKPSGGAGSEGGAGGGVKPGVKILTNPSAADFGKNMKDIASGKVEVRRT